MFAKLRTIVKAWDSRERKIFYSALAVFSLAAVLLGFRIYYALTVEVPAPGGEYIEAVVGQPTVINPILASGNEIDRDLANLLFAGLLTLAEEVKKSEDGRVWSVVLKKDLKWSDGEPLTSDDVTFTLDLIQDINTRSPLIETWSGIVAERESEREIKFTAKTPYAFFKDALQNLKIIPRHIFGNIPPGNIRLSNFNLEPVGGGPFVFRGYEKRKDGFITEYAFERNPNYAGEPAYLDKFKMTFIQNSSEAIARFNTLGISGFGGLDARELDKIKAGFKTWTVDLPRYYAVFMNQSTHPALKDTVVRNALAMAVDRNSIAATALGGQARAIFGPILPGIEGYDASIYANEKYSPEEAAKLLEDNKWLVGEDGVREKIAGKIKNRLEFELVVPQIPFLIAAANAVKDDWSKIGVKTVVISINPAEINDAVIKTRNYHMLLFGNILNNNPDIFAFWHSSERFYPFLNLAIYGNKKADGLLETIRRDFNPETRVENIKKLQELLLADRPAVFLFSPTYLYLATKNLDGFETTGITTLSNRFNSVNKWYLKTKRVFK